MTSTVWIGTFRDLSARTDLECVFNTSEEYTAYQDALLATGRFMASGVRPVSHIADVPAAIAELHDDAQQAALARLRELFPDEALNALGLLGAVADAQKRLNSAFIPPAPVLGEGTGGETPPVVSEKTGDETSPRENSFSPESQAATEPATVPTPPATKAKTAKPVKAETAK